MHYCSVAWSAGMLPIELLRFLALPAIERQIDARLQFVAWQAPREVFSALTRTAFVVSGLRFHPERMRKKFARGESILGVSIWGCEIHL